MNLQVVHAIDYRESGPDGVVAELRPHAGAVDWQNDGQTCDPGIPCSGQSVSSGGRCGKREAVVELLAKALYARVDSAQPLYLCGGHFNVHRAGKVVRIYVIPARAADRAEPSAVRA